MGVGHVDGGALVAHVDDADALGVQPVELLLVVVIHEGLDGVDRHIHEQRSDGVRK